MRVQTYGGPSQPWGPACLQVAPAATAAAACSLLDSRCHLHSMPSAGLLSSLTSTFTDMGLDVVRADIGGKGGAFHDTFWVTMADGQKVRLEGCAAVLSRASEHVDKPIACC